MFASRRTCVIRLGRFVPPAPADSHGHFPTFPSNLFIPHSLSPLAISGSHTLPAYVERDRFCLLVPFDLSSREFSQDIHRAVYP